VNTFQQLQAKGELLILPNAWDAGTARLIESCGARAIATSSAALAWSNGYPDGNALPVPLLIQSVEAIARVIKIPLSVDSEGGYAAEPGQVAKNLSAVADAGASGVNLEDGRDDPDLLRAKIEAVKAVRPHLFVNARVDVLLFQLVPRERAVGEIVRRATLYRDAGCDGIFVPTLSAPEEIAAIVAAVDPLPLNVMAVRNLPPAVELKRLGVRRLSAGASIGRASIALTKRLATRFLEDGSSDAVFENIAEVVDMNGLLRTTYEA
jgi:2-methylisocitrate lyase-like PEP mutase family enzyme